MYLATNSERALYVTNHNQRLIVARTSIGMQIATSRLAFVDSIIWELEIPPNSFAVVNEEYAQVKPLWMNETRYDFSIPKNLNEIFLSYISENPGCYWEHVIDKAIYPQFSKDCASLAALVGHRLFEECLKNHQIHCKLNQAIGIDGQPAPKFSLYPGRANSCRGATQNSE